MKQVWAHSITNIDRDPFDRAFLLRIPLALRYGDEVDMSQLLLERRNHRIDYRGNPRLWNEVFSPKDEIALFKDAFHDAIARNRKVHIVNCSLSEEVEMIRRHYSDMGYFDAELNRFVVDFPNAPVTIGVNIRNIIYSCKDYRSQKENVFVIPPPREPRHQKAMKAWINAWAISTIGLNDPETEKHFLERMILEEKTDLLKLGKNLFFNYVQRGYGCDEGSLILRLSPSEPS